MKPFIIIICKIAGFILKVFGRGSVLPGSLALKMNKKIMSYFKMPKLTIAVTGNNW